MVELQKNELKIGLVRGKSFLAHDIADSHPENPARLSLLPAQFPEPKEGRVVELPLATLQESDFTKLHVPELWNQLKSLRGQQGWIDPDTYYGSKSWDTAVLAAGSTLELGKRIWSGDLRRGFALVRPPGHHATPRWSMGFCLMNNVAIAAAGILAEKPQARIAIVDFDLHHGNGTQDAFYDDDRVLFVSSHRYPFYPGTGAITEIGQGKGKGTTFNFPVHNLEGDEFFVGLYRELVSPILRAFRPEMILVSAGFDGHRLDPMHGLQMETETFGKISQVLIDVAEQCANGKILFCLEGGYSPEALAQSVNSVWNAMLIDPKRSALPAAPSLDVSAWESYRKFFSL